MTRTTNIDDHLHQYLDPEQVEPLDPLVKEVLADHFSPASLRSLKGASPATIQAAVQEPMGREILRRLAEIHESEIDTMIAWYQENAKAVSTIHCPKDGIIALRVDLGNPDLVNKHTAHLDGAFYVGVVGKLLSYRPRLDGEVGFQCICGNNNLWTKLELEHIPTSHVNSVLTPEDLFAVKMAIEHNKYQPNIKKTKLGYTIDNFEHKRVI